MHRFLYIVHMKVSIGVMPYVYKYLAHTYGRPPYDVTFSQQNDIRISLENMHLTAEPFVPERRLPGRYIELDIGENHQLARLIESHRPLIKSGHFFEHQFHLAMRRYVQAQESLAKKEEMPRTAWNKMQALADFLQIHDITEEEYSLESAYKQLYRLRDEDLVFLAAKVRQKFGFSGAENQHFKLCRINGEKRRQVVFYCFSRSAEDIVRKRAYIPKPICEHGNWQTYAENLMRVINDFLIRGQSVA